MSAFTTTTIDGLVRGADPVGAWPHMPPSEADAFRLSLPGADLQAAAAACVSEADCGACAGTTDVEASYLMRRTFGSDIATRIMQGTSSDDVNPVFVLAPAAGASALQLYNPASLVGVLDGRGSTNPLAMRSDGGAMAARSMGVVAAAPRAEQIVGTVSADLSQPSGGEFLMSRASLPTTFPSSMNLVPQSESDWIRAQNACLQNGLNERLVGLKIAHATAAATGSLRL